MKSVRFDLCSGRTEVSVLVPKMGESFATPASSQASLLHAGVFTGAYLEITDGEGAWERQCEDAEARGLLWNDSNAVEILRGQDMLLL